MFKIGEFSKITMVSIRMLRYYDEQKLLVPAIIDENNGYRLYKAKQIDQLNKIITLKDMGFNVKEIRELLKDNEDIIKDKMFLKIEETKENIKLENLKIARMQYYINDIHKEDKLKINIVMKSLPKVKVISLRKKVQNYYCEYTLWQELMPYFKDVKNHEKLQSFTIYHDTDYREEDVDIEICVFIDNLHIKCDKLIYREIEEVDMAATFMVYGPYSNISNAYKEFAYWLENHPQYEMMGENRQVCHVSNCHTDNEEEYITELQIPLRYK